jgi:hypothetical protein
LRIYLYSFVKFEIYPVEYSVIAVLLPATLSPSSLSSNHSI